MGCGYSQKCARSDYGGSCYADGECRGCPEYFAYCLEEINVRSEFLWLKKLEIRQEQEGLPDDITHLFKDDLK